MTAPTPQLPSPPAPPSLLRAILDRALVALYIALAALPVFAMWAGIKGRQLSGVTEPVKRLPLETGAFLSERYQHQLAAWFEANLGLRGTSISFDNALLYHVFGETKHGSTVRLGEGGVLFSSEDIIHVNKAGWMIPTQETVDRIADQIAELQRRMRAAGRALVPVFIPAKTSVWRDSVPAAWLTDGPRDVRLSDTKIYGALRAALERRGVLFADARRRFDEVIASGVPRAEVFGPDARHWSVYGACLANAEIAERYAELTGRPRPPHHCELSHASAPRMHDDYDLLRLLNAFFVYRGVRRPPAVVHPEPDPAVTEPRTLLVGTSFCWPLLRDGYASGLYRTPHYNYYDQQFVEWPASTQFPVDSGSPRWREVVRNKDLYVLDLFESYLTAPNTYVNLFLDAMLAELDREPLPPAVGAAQEPAGGSTTIR